MFERLKTYMKFKMTYILYSISFVIFIVSLVYTGYSLNSRVEATASVVGNTVIIVLMLLIMLITLPNKIYEIHQRYLKYRDEKDFYKFVWKK